MTLLQHSKKMFLSVVFDSLKRFRFGFMCTIRQTKYQFQCDDTKIVFYDIPRSETIRSLNIKIANNKSYTVSCTVKFNSFFASVPL